MDSERKMTAEIEFVCQIAVETNSVTEISVVVIQ